MVNSSNRHCLTTGQWRTTGANRRDAAHPVVNGPGFFFTRVKMKQKVEEKKMAEKEKKRVNGGWQSYGTENTSVFQAPKFKKGALFNQPSELGCWSACPAPMKREPDPLTSGGLQSPSFSVHSGP